MKYSVLVPAHNEAAYIGNCLQSIKDAAENVTDEVEIIVALNRCTDQTADIAAGYQAVIVNEDRKNPGLVWQIMKGNDQKAADLFYYHPDR